MRVIVADGSLHIRSVLRAMLGGLGVSKVVDADNMAVALERLELNVFDVLIVDERLPPKGAVGLLKAIHDLGSAHADLAPIMMTARPTVQRVASARKFGIEEILTKPFSIADLDARIKRCVCVRRQERAEFRAPDQPAPSPEPGPTDGRAVEPEAPAGGEIEREIVYL